MAAVTPLVINWINNQPIPLIASNVTAATSNAPTSTSYTIQSTDFSGQIESASAGGTLTVTLPNTFPNGFYFWVSVSVNDLILSASGGANILGPSGNSIGVSGTTYSFSAQNKYQSARIVFDGTNWWVTTTQGSGQLYDIQFVISGGGSPILTGNKGWLHNPVVANIVAWRIFGDVSGSITVDIFRNNLSPGSTSIVGSGTKPFVTTSTGNQAVPSGWTSTFIIYDDWLSFDVTANTSFTLVTVCLTCQRV